MKYVKNILAEKKIFDEKDDLFEKFLSKFDLLDQENFDDLIKKNGKKTMNASKECLIFRYTI